MPWTQYIKIAMLNSLGVLVGILWVPVDRAVAQSYSPEELDVQFTQTADFWDSQAPLLEMVQVLAAAMVLGGISSSTIAIIWLNAKIRKLNGSPA